MNRKDKLLLEKSGENVIRLYKEGIFYVAYNHSALRFLRFVNSNVTLIKQELANGEWYFRIGIVALSSMLQGLALKDELGSYKQYVEIECEKVETSLENVTEYQLIQGSGKQRKRMKDEAVGIQEMIIEQIKNINIGTLTPITAVTLINDWQNKLK